MRSLMLVVLLMAIVLVLNWPSSTVHCVAKDESVRLVSGDDERVPRGQTWSVVADPLRYSGATVWVYDEETAREIVSQTLRVNADGMLVADITIDERFNGVNACWMWIQGN